MSVQAKIEEKLRQTMGPEYFEVINESQNHRVPPGSESHFKVLLVTRQFEGISAIARHRMVNRLLADELAGPIHALSLRLFTPDQWQAEGGQHVPSPPCAHA